MKMIVFNSLVLVGLLFLNSCGKEELVFAGGEMEIVVETGENWLHDYPLFLGLSKKNPPQFAIWLEDTCGNYLSSVFVTYKIATEGWQANNGNRRKEALPHWCHQRGIIYKDGLLLPTKENPLTDGITGATPKENKSIQLSIANFREPFVVKAEFNHSVDFNDSFPKEAIKGDDNYSGGKEGSGQPATIYAATVYPGVQKTELQLIGHSSPDGTDGAIDEEMDGITSAKSIVKSIYLIIH